MESVQLQQHVSVTLQLLPKDFCGVRIPGRGVVATQITGESDWQGLGRGGSFSDALSRREPYM